MRNHLKPPAEKPQSIVKTLELRDGCTYELEDCGNFVRLVFRAPPGKVFVETGMALIHRIAWRRHLVGRHECQFLASAFAVMSHGYLDAPNGNQPT